MSHKWLDEESQSDDGISLDDETCDNIAINENACAWDLQFGELQRMVQHKYLSTSQAQLMRWNW